MNITNTALEARFDKWINEHGKLTWLIIGVGAALNILVWWKALL